MSLSTQTLKICSSCKRNLCTSHFGVSRRTSDGFNYTCKECRNYRKRRHYHQTTSEDLLDSGTHVFPLAENNIAILKKLIRIEQNQSLTAQNSRTGELLAVLMEFIQKNWIMTVTDQNRFQYVVGFPHDAQTDYLNTACRHLEKLEIRLNWPFNRLSSV